MQQPRPWKNYSHSGMPGTGPLCGTPSGCPKDPPAARSDGAPRSRWRMMSATQSCRSRCQTRPIRVHVSHGDGSVPGSGRLLRSAGVPAREKAASSASILASIVSPGPASFALLSMSNGEATAFNTSHPSLLDALQDGVGDLAALRRCELLGAIVEAEAVLPG